eukprot:526904_1
MSPVVQVFVGVASILSICLSQCDMPVGKVQSDKREDKTTLIVANLNAEWLYQDGCRNWNAFLQVSKGPAWGTATNWPAIDAGKIAGIINEADTHIQSVADELARLKADIYVIEEVCDCKTLETVISKMPAANRWMYKAYLKLNTKDHTGTNMAHQTGLITKLEPTAISNSNFQANIKLVPFVNDQKIFRAEFMLNAPGKQFPLILYGVHLPSGPKEGAFNLRKLRLGHVLTAMKNDATLAPNALIIGTGDLNTWKGRKEYILATYRIASNAGDTRSRYATFETAYNSDRTAPLTIRDIEIEKDTISPYAGGKVGIPNPPAGISNLHWGSKLVKVLYGASSDTAEEHNVRKIEQVKTKCEAAKDGAPASDAQQYYFALLFTNREKAEDTTLNSIINDPELVLFNDDSYHHTTARNKYTHISCDDPEVKNVLDYFFGPASMKKYAMDITKAVKYDHRTAACGRVSDHEAISVEFRLGFLLKDQIHYKKPYSDEPYYFQFKIVLLSIALLSIAVFSILLFCGVMYIFGAICGYFLAIWVKRTQNLMEIGRKQPGIF